NAAELGDGLVDDRAAMCWVGQITADQYTFAAGVVHQLRHVLRIVIFIEVGNQHIGAFSRKGDRDRAADPAVTTGDHRTFAGQPARASITAFAAIRNRVHARLYTGHRLLLLGKAHAAHSFQIDPASHAVPHRSSVKTGSRHPRAAGASG